MQSLWLLYPLRGAILEGMKSFAIIRHAKIKAGRHLVSAGLHNGRGADTPNADPDAPPVEILIGSAKPHRDVRDELRRREVGKPRKGAVVAVETFLGASPEWWASKGWKPGVTPTGELASLVADWKAEQMVYLLDRFGDRLVSAIYHGDEASPHIQAMSVPTVWRKDGREKGERAGREAWRLDASIDLGSPMALKALHTAYADRMARFGLVRGKDISTADRIASGQSHQPLVVWQRQEAAKDAERDRIIDGLRDVHRETIEARDAAKLSADAARLDAEKAAQVLRDAEDREAAVRVSERRIAADLVKAEVVKRSQALERSKLDAEKGALATIAGELAEITRPIREMAKRWTEAKAITRQTMGQKGEIAAEVEAAPEISVLDALLKRLRGVTR
jgi:hypothetical protein